MNVKSTLVDVALITAFISAFESPFAEMQSLMSLTIPFGLETFVTIFETTVKLLWIFRNFCHFIF